MGYGELMLTVAIVIAAVMIITWVVSLVLRDASVVDPVWPLAFIAVAITALIAGSGDEGRRILIACVVAIWGARLSIHLLVRNAGKEEDFRYAAMRAKRGHRFWLTSLVTVFLLQGLLVWVVSLPVQLSAIPDRPLGWLAIVGAIMWAIGVVFETIGDTQLMRFKANPGSRGQVLNTGLWRYTRHPNYFGDFLVWWGIFLIAAESGAGAWGVAGPLLMTLLLVKVSGAGLLEKDIAVRRPGYADYVRRTSGFIPRPPKRG
jgi:steroid 5-alpha reductase family enzyme